MRITNPKDRKRKKLFKRIGDRDIKKKSRSNTIVDDIVTNTRQLNCTRERPLVQAEHGCGAAAPFICLS